MRLLLLLSLLVVSNSFAEELSSDGDASEGRASKTINVNDIVDNLNNKFNIDNLGNIGNLGTLDIQKPDLSALTGTDTDPVGQLLLAIGNVLGLFNDIPGLTELLEQLDAAGITGVPATILASIVALSAGKASFLSLLLKPLQIANQVLAIIGIALLGTYLVESEGDFTGLLRRSDDESADYYSYAAYDPEATDPSYYANSPIIQKLGNYVDEAVGTYEELNSNVAH